MRRLEIRVEGRVQGVFFRANTKEKALDLGLTGFVMNEDDGSVLVEAEGEDFPLNQFLIWLRKGPVLSKVQTVNAEEIPLKHTSEFKIKYSQD